MVQVFADPAIDPHMVAREWATSAPQALEDLRCAGRLAVAELLHAYGELAAAIVQSPSLNLEMLVRGLIAV
jgi:hypothetical protein